jgi:hypothetical protein
MTPSRARSATCEFVIGGGASAKASSDIARTEPAPNPSTRKSRRHPQRRARAAADPTSATHSLPTVARDAERARPFCMPLQTNPHCEFVLARTHPIPGPLPLPINRALLRSRTTTNQGGAVAHFVHGRACTGTFTGRNSGTEPRSLRAWCAGPALSRGTPDRTRKALRSRPRYPRPAAPRADPKRTNNGSAAPCDHRWRARPRS